MKPRYSTRLSLEKGSHPLFMSSLERKRPEDALRFLGLGRERGALSEKDFRSFREAVLKWKEEHGDSSPGSDLRDGPGGPA